MEQGEIILYQPDEAVKLEVRLEDETVWLTQEQIADLFGTKRPAITKHLNNIYKSGELDIDSTCSILEHMGNDGKQRYTTKYYKLVTAPVTINETGCTHCILSRYKSPSTMIKVCTCDSKKNVRYLPK